MRGCADAGALVRERPADFVALVGREHPCVVATGLHAASLAKRPRVSCYARCSSSGNARGLAIARGHPRRAPQQRTPQTPSDRPSPAGVGGPANVDPDRFSDVTAPQKRRWSARRPGFVAARVRARASAEGGVRRLAGPQAGRSSLSARVDARDRTPRDESRASTPTRRCKTASGRRSIPRPFAH